MLLTTGLKQLALANALSLQWHAQRSIELIYNT